MRQFLILFILGAALNASASSLIGPFEPWQTPALGFNSSGNDRGGPKNLGDEYRWNIPTIAYGFDRAFLDFFGEQGAAAVEEAIQVLNALPPASELDPLKFGQDTRRINLRAQAEELIDLKTTTLSLLLEQLGLAQPERWVWTLRDRSVRPTETNYLVVQRNFDPVTWSPSAFVNGTRYTYQVLETDVPAFADAFETPLDRAEAFSSLAGLQAAPAAGVYAGALTQDDAGGLRYLLHPANLNIEPAPSGTNGPAALRPGPDKLSFVRMPTEWSTTSGWRFTNVFSDIRYDGIEPVETQVRRIVTRPDIVFSAAELPPNRLWSVDGPRFAKATELGDQAGPGVIQPGVTIALAKLTGGFINQFPGRTSEGAALRSPRWGSFDGAAQVIPLVYPVAMPQTAPRLSASIVSAETGRHFQVRFDGASNAAYELQSSSDLRQWSGGIVLSNSAGRHEAALELNEPQAFFRVVKVPPP